jgi:hypothetical protein
MFIISELQIYLFLLNCANHLPTRFLPGIGNVERPLIRQYLPVVIEDRQFLQPAAPRRKRLGVAAGRLVGVLGSKTALQQSFKGQEAAAELMRPTNADRPRRFS